MATKSEMLAAATVSDPRWDAVVTRDRRADGQFFYSVKTNGRVLPAVVRSTRRAP